MIIFVSLAVAGVVAWAFFLYVIWAGKGEISSLAAEAEDKVRQERALSSVRLLADDVRESIGVLDGAFVGSEEVADFVELIEEGARASRVSVEISSLSLDEDEKKPVRPLLLRVEAVGTWRNLASFIARTEGEPRAIVIDKVALIRSEAEEGAGEWKASFELSARVIE